MNWLIALETLNLLAELKKEISPPRRRARGKTHGSRKVQVRPNIPPFPTIRKQHIERRVVIEAYAKYDCSKKHRPVPDFLAWDWSQANIIDAEMSRANLKTGVPAGYLLWDEIEVTTPVLRECAVHSVIFPKQSRKLGLIGDSELLDWKLKCDKPWYEGIARGGKLDDAAPMLLRPATRGESPARWYIEDGSGRAIAFVANQQIFDPSRTLAIGYLGRNPDPNSSFMQEKLSELL